MNEQRQPRIGIIGAGAVGGFYGFMLAQVGFEVHYLLRSDYEAVNRHGLRISSAVHGELHQPQVHAWHDPADMPPCDWVFVAAKTTSNTALAPIINQVAAQHAKVVLLQNGFGIEDQIRPLLDEHLHLLGGLCFIYVHRSAPGVIQHQAQGGVNLGYHSGPADDEQGHAIAQQGVSFFQQAGLDSKVLKVLEQARWQKLVWNIPYNGLSVLLNSDIEQLMSEAYSRELITQLMDETIAAAQACGYALPDTMVQALLKYTDAMPAYFPSMYHDFAQKRPMELQAIYHAPLAVAQAAGCSMPKTSMLVQTLEYLSAQ